MRIARNFFFRILILGVLLGPRAEAASKIRVYVLCSTYGVMAGTLTGLATLAFYSDPSGHLGNVSKGASLGLYAGILLGTYLLYLQPDPKLQKEREDKRKKQEEEDKKKEAKDDEARLDSRQLHLEEELIDLDIPRWSPQLDVSATGTPMLGLAYRF